jgi:hypothetical protein
MPTPTYTPLANITLGSAASSVTFSSIPATYRDLILVVTARSTETTDNFDALRARFNGDSGSNYVQVSLSAGTTSPQSSTGTATQVALGRLATSQGGKTSPGVGLIHFIDYAQTDKHKTILARGNAANEGIGVDAIANRWASTAAITTILLFPAVGANFASGATFNLYGVIA